MKLLLIAALVAISTFAQMPEKAKITKGDITIEFQTLTNTVYGPMTRVSLDCSDADVYAFKVTVIADGPGAPRKKAYVVEYADPVSPFIARTAVVDVNGSSAQIMAVFVEKLKVSGSESF